jgi:hypothetical protein
VANFRLLFLAAVCFVFSGWTNNANAQGTCPINIGFETGDFSLWTCSTGSVARPGNVNTITLTDNPTIGTPTPGRHEIKSSPTEFDPYSDGNIPVLSPNGSAHSVKLGNDQVNSQAEGISYTFNVPNDVSEYTMTYYYAVVFEDPAHPASQQPRFKTRLFDVAANAYVTCASFDFIATSGLPGFTASTTPGHNGAAVYYKKWSPVTINLSAYLGKTMRLDFITADCTESGHFGYAYVDVNDACTTSIIGNNNCENATSISLTGPSGYQNYTWYETTLGSTVAGTGQTLTLSPAPASGTRYWLHVDPYPGFGCATDYSTVIAKYPFQLTLTDVAVCSPGTADLTSTAVTAGSTAGLIYTFWLDPGGTIPITDPAAIAQSGTYYIQGTSAIGGCTDIKPVTVTINLPPGVTIHNPSPVCVPATVDLTDPDIVAGSTAGLTYSYWFDAAATSPIPGPTTMSISGTYYIKGTNSSGCSVIKPVTVVVSALPHVVANDPAAVCAPLKVDLTDAAITAGSTGGLNYTYWKDAAATIAVPVANAIDQSGTYYVRGANAAGCYDIQPVVVTIHPSPALVITDPAPVCSPSVVDLTDAAVTAGSTAGVTLTYWQDAAATVAIASPQAITQSGVYYIRARNVLGCFDIKPVTVDIKSTPTLAITHPAAVCTPDKVNLTDAAVTAGSSPGLTFTYWKDAGATIGVAVPSAVNQSGTYYIRAENSTGCSVIKPVTVVVNPTPVVIVTNPARVCAPAAIDLTDPAITAGSSPGLTITYWQDAAATIAVTSPQAVDQSGTYYIRGATASCSVVMPVSVQIDASPQLVVSAPAAVCAPGKVDLTAAAVTAGSTPGLTLTYWRDAATTLPVSVPNAIDQSGTYYIRGENGAGCFDSKPVTITVNPSPVVVITDPARVCTPQTVDLTASAVKAGSSPSLILTYWQDAAATVSIASPQAITQSGTYYIRGQNAAGCFVVMPVNVQIDDAPVLVVHSPPAICSPGKIDLTLPAVTAGSPAGLTLTYWADATATLPIAVPNAVDQSGTYYIKAANAAGCFDIKPVTVVVDDPPVVIITDPSRVCAPLTIDLTAPSITAGSSSQLILTYWSDAAATLPVTSPQSVSQSGTYYIRGQNTAGCFVVMPVNVQIDPATHLIINTPPAVCTPERVDLTAAAVTSGSTPGLTISFWKDAAATIPVTVPNAIDQSGTYYIRGMNAAGCIDIKPVVVTIHTLPVLLISDPESVCSPLTVDLTGPAVTAGSTPQLALTYWKDAAATMIIPSPQAISQSGVYYIKATNASGCFVIKPVNVAINTPPQIVITPPAPVCVPLKIDLTAAAVTAGSTPGITLTFWKDAAATLPVTIPNAIDQSGTYYIRGENAAGCFDIKPVNVTINITPILVITNPAPVCSPANVDITTAAITAGSSSQLSLSYWRDATATLPIASPQAISQSGVYYIKGTNASGCFDIRPVMVQIDNPPVLIIHPPAAVCAPATVDLTAPGVTAGSSPGLTLTYWRNAAATDPVAIANAISQSGTYYIKGTNSAGCSWIQPVTLVVNNPPIFVVTNPPRACAPAVVDLTAPAITAGSQQQLSISYWKNEAATDPLASPQAIAASGNYYIRAATSSGCSVILPVTVIIDPLPVVTVHNPEPLCAPATCNLTATAITAGSTPGLTFTYWKNAQATIAIPVANTIGQSGTYYIKGTNSAGCSDIKAVTVVINPAPTLIITDPAKICTQETFDLTAPAITAGSSSQLILTYWKDGGASIPVASPQSVAEAGIYYIRAVNSAGCGTVKPVILSYLTPPDLQISNPAPVCFPETIDLTVPAIISGSSPGITLSYWADAATVIALSDPHHVSTSGTYYIKATNASGCYTVKPVSVLIGAMPKLSLHNPAPICAPLKVDLTAPEITDGSTAGLNYTYWKDANATIPVAISNAISESGRYYVKGTTIAGCAAVGYVDVTINSTPVLQVINPPPVCSPATVSIASPDVVAANSGQVSLSYWRDVAGSNQLQDPTAIAQSGTYYIRSMNSSGCFSMAPVIVTILPPPSFTITTPSAQYIDQPVNLTRVPANPSSALTYTYWKDPNAQVPVSNPSSVTESGTYFIRGINSGGCSVVLPVDISLVPSPSIQVPSAFTPLQITNNKLYPFVPGLKTLTSFKVFNKWGNLVFQTKDPSPEQGWDGYYKGSMHFFETYTWYVEGLDGLGKVIRKSGNTLLLR